MVMLYLHGAGLEYESLGSSGCREAAELRELRRRKANIGYIISFNINIYVTLSIS